MKRFWVVLVCLLLTGCTAVSIEDISEFPQETTTQSTDAVMFNFSDYEIELDGETLELPEYLRISDIPDGRYTVIMTDIDTIDTCTFFLWEQKEVNQDFIDSMGVGDSFEDYEITEVVFNEVNPFIRFGTEYSGEIVYVNDADLLYFAHVKDSDTWKLFSGNDVPVYDVGEANMLPVSDDVVVYDSRNALLNEENPSIEKINDVLEFRDEASISDGSIEDFFLTLSANSYAHTYIDVSGGEIVAVYFCYKA